MDTGRRTVSARHSARLAGGWSGEKDAHGQTAWSAWYRGRAEAVRWACAT